jgi:hypothetical protein
MTIEYVPLELINYAMGILLRKKTELVDILVAGEVEIPVQVHN